MNAKKWFINFISIGLSLLLLIAGLTAYVDPFFVYHAPARGIFYKLDDQRHQSRGIAERFEYNGLIVGTSITQNFKPSILDSEWGTTTVKIPNSGATFKEVADIIDAAYESGHELEFVLRSVDLTSILKDKDEIRTDMGEYPTYLYDRNPLNDVKYLLNMEVFVDWVIPDLTADGSGWTDFDEYNTFEARLGTKRVLKGRDSFNLSTTQETLSEDERNTVAQNIEENFVRQIKSHPETEFILFYPCYSIAFWGMIQEMGLLEKYLEAEKISMEMLLKYDNVKVYAFNNETDIITNLDNYSDYYHYSSEINDYILNAIINDYDRIDSNNYESYLAGEYELLHDFNYNALFPEE